MPELPEVETVLEGIKPYLTGKIISSVIVRQAKLRWLVPNELNLKLKNQLLISITRRGKYLLFKFSVGTMLIHLGMSGHLRVLRSPIPPEKHDHVDILFAENLCLRYRDPRRFGTILWINSDKEPAKHFLLCKMGPEPLSQKFTGNYLYKKALGRKIAVKIFLMDSKIVPGIGNIYATEALFLAKILPSTPAGKVTPKQYANLVSASKSVLKKAIKKGGTTLRDYKKSDGTPGHFKLAIQIYGKAGKPCPQCKTKLQTAKIGQRSSVYCPHCQQ